LKLISSDAQAIPAAGGTYALLLFCPRARTLRIGSLGGRTIPRGWYVYVGSAFGPGGLRARCLHHIRPLRRRRWHIDYLRLSAAVKAIWFTGDPAPREHQWAEIVGILPGAAAPIPRFGSSDCRCPSHLFRFVSRPSFATFREQALRRLPAHAPIGAFSAAMPRHSCRNAL
jgi:Uri superfamily endonuclease